MRLARDGDAPAPRRLPAPYARRVPRGDQRREVPDGPTLHEAAAGLRRHPGEIGHPAQRLVLGVDRARAFEPAAAVERRGADDQVEQRRRFGRRSRDEREVPGVVDRHGRRREHVRPDTQGALAAEALRGDRLAGAPLELLRGGGAVQRSIHPQAVKRDAHHRLREPLRLARIAVHVHAPQPSGGVAADAPSVRYRCRRAATCRAGPRMRARA